MDNQRSELAILFSELEKIWGSNSFKTAKNIQNYFRKRLYKIKLIMPAFI